MKYLKATGLIQTTVKTSKNPKASGLKRTLETFAADEGLTISDFNVVDGQAVVGLPDADSARKLKDALTREDVDATEISAIQLQRMLTEAAQKRSDKMMASKSRKES